MSRRSAVVLFVVAFAMGAILWPHGEAPATKSPEIKEDPARLAPAAETATQPPPPPADDRRWGFCPTAGESLPKYSRPLLSRHVSDGIAELLRTSTSSPGLASRIDRLVAPRVLPVSDVQLAAFVPALQQEPPGAAAGNLLRTALEASRSDPNLAMFRVRLAARLLPNHPLPLVTEALVADDAVWMTEEIAALRRARTLAPKEPAIALAAGRRLRHTPKLEEAIAAWDEYLASNRDDIRAVRTRALLGVQREILQSDDGVLTRNGLDLVWDRVALGAVRASALHASVESALSEAAEFTGTRQRDALTTVVYGSREELFAVTCAPIWSGAQYDGTLRLFAEDDERAGVSDATVRHEALHAQLDPWVPRQPTWVAEGLAQYFEGRRIDARRRIWLLLVKTGGVPFSQLEGSTRDWTPAQASVGYAQSLAMIEFLIAEKGPQAVVDLVQLLRRRSRDPLLDTLVGRTVDRADVTRFIASRIGATVGEEDEGPIEALVALERVTGTRRPFDEPPRVEAAPEPVPSAPPTPPTPSRQPPRLPTPTYQRPLAMRRGPMIGAVDARLHALMLRDFLSEELGLTSRKVLVGEDVSSEFTSHLTFAGLRVLPAFRQTDREIRVQVMQSEAPRGGPMLVYSPFPEDVERGRATLSCEKVDGRLRYVVSTSGLLRANFNPTLHLPEIARILP